MGIQLGMSGFIDTSTPDWSVLFKLTSDLRGLGAIYLKEAVTLILGIGVHMIVVLCQY